MSLICPECGVPLVPFGGEDVCMQYCETCDGHDCECYESNYDDEPQTELFDERNEP